MKSTGESSGRLDSQLEKSSLQTCHPSNLTSSEAIIFFGDTSKGYAQEKREREFVEHMRSDPGNLLRTNNSAWMEGTKIPSRALDQRGDPPQSQGHPWACQLSICVAFIIAISNSTYRSGMCEDDENLRVLGPRSEMCMRHHCKLTLFRVQYTKIWISISESSIK